MPDLAAALDNAQPREANRVAALDIGSNSFHLVVARIIAHDIQILHRIKLPVKLASGLDDDGILSDEAIERGLDGLKAMSTSLQDFEPDSVRVVATYTLRKARNARRFVDAARQIFPHPVEVISGSEEARLIYLGVAHTSHYEGQRLVIDIGGGSTECIIGERFDPLLLRSLQMGHVTYTNKFFKQGVLKQKHFEKAVTAASQELELIDLKFKKLGWGTCLGSSGTIRAIADLCSQMEGGSPGLIRKKELKQLTRTCLDAGSIDQLQLEGLSDDRKPTFIAGLAILTAIFSSLDIEEMTYSSAALREGVLYDMEDRMSDIDVRERTVQSLLTRYDVDVAHAQRVLTTVLALYDQIAEPWKADSKELRALISWAALLHEVGLQINSRGVQKHSAYILRSVELPGFNQEQQELLATLVRFHRKKIRQEDIAEFVLFESPQVKKLLLMLRLAVLLNIKRLDDFVPTFESKVDKYSLKLTFPKDWLQDKPIILADLKREQTQADTMGINFEFR